MTVRYLYQDTSLLLASAITVHFSFALIGDTAREDALPESPP